MTREMVKSYKKVILLKFKHAIIISDTYEMAHGRKYKIYAFSEIPNRLLFFPLHTPLDSIMGYMTCPCPRSTSGG